MSAVDSFARQPGKNSSEVHHYSTTGMHSHHHFVFLLVHGLTIVSAVDTHKRAWKKTSDNILSVGSASPLLLESTATISFCAMTPVVGGLACASGVDAFAR